MTSCCIYHLLVHLMVSFTLALMSSFFSFSHTTDYPIILFFLPFLYTPLSPSVSPPPSPWTLEYCQPSKDEPSKEATHWDKWVCFQKFVQPPGRGKIRHYRREGEWKRNSEVKKETKYEQDMGRMRDTVHQGTLCTLLGRYLNLGVCNAVVPCFISFFSSLLTEKSRQ